MTNRCMLDTAILLTRVLAETTLTSTIYSLHDLVLQREQTDTSGQDIIILIISQVCFFQNLINHGLR